MLVTPPSRARIQLAVKVIFAAMLSLCHMLVICAAPDGLSTIAMSACFDSSKARTSTSLRYKRIDLFNSTEHAFLIALRKTAPSHIAVLAKVRVADIVSPQDNDVAAFNRIARKHVDFVLYNLQTRSVLRASELDGPAHASKRAIKSDNVKNSCFASARVPLTRVAVIDWNRTEVLRALFKPSSEGLAGPSAVLTGGAGETRLDTMKPPGAR